MGIGNIRSVVEELTKLPLTVVNSHSHFDHVGDNWRFREVRLLDCPREIERLRQGFRLSEGDANISPAAFHYPGKLWFDPADLQVRPCRVKPVREGDCFELGGRRLKVIASPGHSEDGLVLADEENRLLFTGDTVYPGPLYAHRADSGPDRYRDTILRLAAMFSDYTLCCSHNAPLWEGGALAEVGTAFEKVVKEKEKRVKEYRFQGFSIIA